ncbi:MAG: type IV toxin-antitoxin system AbiEi family antitoxin domain-containing protein [Candidatus Woesearchaeota archaeon]
MNEELAQFPYFTGKMLKAFLHKNQPSTTITRWKDKFIQIEKGKYTVHQNPFIYASIIIRPSYISFRSALYFYQLTNQIPIRIEVMTPRYKQNTNELIFYTSKHIFGYEKTVVDTFDIFIATKEKLLLDCLLYPKAGVMIDELDLLLKESLDLGRIVEYLKKINKLSLIKKCGYLLETQNMHIYEYFKQQIKEDKNYILLNSNKKKGKNINHKWRLYDNENRTSTNS